MPKIDFSDNTIYCQNRHVIGFERLDRQILVIGETAIFNFARLRCMQDGCFSVVEWIAPSLKADDISSINDIPNPKQIERRANRLKEKFQKLGYRPKQTGNYPNQTEQPQATDF